MKNVWFINQYITTPEIEGDGYRHYYIAKELQKKDYNPLLITSSFSHAPYRHNPFIGLYKFVNKQVPTLILKGNKYGKSEGIGRLVSWVVFCFSLCLLPFISRRKVPKPDIIVLSSLPLLPIINVLFFRLLYPKSKFIFEIRDLWPLSGIELGGYSEKNVFIRILGFLEKLAYKKADTIISVIPRADRHISKVLGHENFHYEWITNGYKMPESAEGGKLEDVLDVVIKKTNFNIGYAGTLVVANPLDTIIEVVGNHEDQHLHFYILGGGPERERFLKLAEKYQNIHVLDRIPKKYVFPFLEQMDLLFMGKGTKETTIYRYGTSQLKTFDYFYAKKPIIQALNSTENPVTYSRAGYVIEPENPEALKEKIDYFLSLNEKDRNSYGERGYEYLLSNSTYKIISEKYAKVLSAVLNGI